MINDLLGGNANNSIILSRKDLHDVLKEMFTEFVQEKRTSEPFLFKEEVIQRYRISDSSLRRWEKMGYLIPGNLGKKKVYRASDIENVVFGNIA